MDEILLRQKTREVVRDKESQGTACDYLADPREMNRTGLLIIMLR